MDVLIDSAAESDAEQQEGKEIEYGRCIIKTHNLLIFVRHGPVAFRGEEREEKRGKGF